MEKVRITWMLEWFVTTVIIISCLPYHVGHTQTQKAQSWEDIFYQMQIKQAIDKAEKDIRRRGKLMMDLEREHPD